MKKPIRYEPFHHADYNTYRWRIGFAKSNRRKPTPAEQRLWEAIRDRKVNGAKFRRQHVVGRYIVDFVCLAQMLIVEVDGDIHLVDDHPEQDEKRSRELEKQGFRIIRFRNEQVMNDLDQVLKIITLHF